MYSYSVYGQFVHNKHHDCDVSFKLIWSMCDCFSILYLVLFDLIDQRPRMLQDMLCVCVSLVILAYLEFCWDARVSALFCQLYTLSLSNTSFDSSCIVSVTHT